MSSSTTQKKKADSIGITVTQAASKSGSDLMQQLLVVKASTTVGPGRDAPLLVQMRAGVQ